MAVWPHNTAVTTPTLKKKILECRGLISFANIFPFLTSNKPGFLVVTDHYIHGK